MSSEDAQDPFFDDGVIPITTEPVVDVTSAPSSGDAEEVPRKGKVVYVAGGDMENEKAQIFKCNWT